MDNIAQVSQQAIAALSQIAALQQRVERLEVASQGIPQNKEPQHPVSDAVVLVMEVRTFLWINEHLVVAKVGDLYQLQAESQGVPVEVIFQGSHIDCLDLLGAIHSARQGGTVHALDIQEWISDRPRHQA